MLGLFRVDPNPGKIVLISCTEMDIPMLQGIMFRLSKSSYLLLQVCLLGSVPKVIAMGFESPMPSASNQGSAGAGSASWAQDSTSLFFNPALITEFDQFQFTTGASVSYSVQDYEFTDATNWAGRSILSPNSTEETTEEVLLSPYIFVTVPINERWHVGLGVSTPQQSDQEFENDVTRYVTTEERIETIEFNPVVAYQVNEKFSVGAGFRANYLDYSSKQEIDMASYYDEICQPPTQPSWCTGVLPRDVEIENSGTNWAFGWNLGATWKYSEKGVLGLSYRSAINHDLTGDSYSGYTVTPTDPQYAPFTNSDFDLAFDIPDVYSISATQRFSEKWLLMLGLDFIRWSVYEPNSITYDRDDTTGVPDYSSDDLKDTVRLSIGTEYPVNPKFRLRTGFAFEQSPLSDDNRTLTFTDTNHYEVSIGLGYWFTDHLGLDMAYTHVFMPDGDFYIASDPFIDPGTGDEIGNLYSLGGTVEQSVDVLTAQFTVRWE